MLLWALLVQADVPVEAWVRPGDVAASRVREAAEAVAKTAESITLAGRAERFAELHTDVAELVRRAATLEAAVGR